MFIAKSEIELPKKDILLKMPNCKTKIATTRRVDDFQKD